MDKVQITEEQAKEMIEIMHTPDHFNGNVIKLWEEKGYIKESTLAKARNFFWKVKNKSSIITTNHFSKLCNLYEEAIIDIIKKWDGRG